VTLPPYLARIVEAEYPRFSEQEMTRRRAAVEALLTQVECDHLVFCGANRFGSAVQWLTQWPVTAEAVGVLTPRERDATRPTGPLPRIHPVERFIEQHDVGVMHERRRDLDALPHTFRVRRDLPVLRVLELHEPDRARRRVLGVGELLKSRAHANKLATGEKPVGRLSFRDKGQTPVNRGIVRRGHTVDQHLARRRLEEAGHHVQHGRLTGAVRSEQPGDSRSEHARDVVDRDDVAVPPRRVAKLDCRHASFRR